MLGGPANEEHPTRRQQYAPGRRYELTAQKHRVHRKSQASWRRSLCMPIAGSMIKRVAISVIAVALIAAKVCFWLPQRHPRYFANGGCPTSLCGQIRWGAPLGGDSLTCTSIVVGARAKLQYFQSNYDAVLGVSTNVTVPGTVGRWPVRWYVTTSDNGQLRRDAILPDLDNKPTVHITVTAHSASDLTAAMKVVEHLKL